jgi:hypothetical protein
MYVEHEHSQEQLEDCGHERMEMKFDIVDATPRQQQALWIVGCVFMALVFFTWALVAMLLGQVTEDSTTLAVIGVGFTILAGR